MGSRLPITVAGYASLRPRALLLKPTDVLPENRYWVAVLIQGKDPLMVSDQGDFLWIKANGKTRVSTVLAQYSARFEGEAQLHMGPEPVQDEERMASLDIYHDRLIVFVVAPKSQSGSASGPNQSAPSTAERSMPKFSTAGSGQVPASAPIYPTQGSHARSQTTASPAMGTAPARSKLGSYSSSPKLSSPLTRPPPIHTPRDLFPRSPVWVLMESPIPNSALASSLGRNSPVQHGTPSGGFPPPGGPSPHPQPSPTQTTREPFVQPQTGPFASYPSNTSTFEGPYDNGHTGAMRNQNARLNNYSRMGNEPFHGTGYGNVTTKHESYPAVPTQSPPLQGLMPINTERLPAQPNTPQLPPDARERSTTGSGRASTVDLQEFNAQPHNPYLQKLLSETTPEKLEAGVQKGLDLLKRIQGPLDEHKSRSADAEQWLQSLEDLKKSATRSRTVIGVAGNTGEGKSSVINAILDEERLVPTNCMRACTAVVTEISWNDDDKSKYRAEVEFIKPEDWKKELDILFSEVIDGSGNVSKECSNPDSEAGVAFAKIKAVYPQKTKEMLAQGGPDMLMREAEVNKVLGTIKHIGEDDCNQFYKHLQFFVDSQEKVTGPDGRRKEKRRMEYWPLIKVVKIYTRSKVLSTGAVVVDLPGVQDSNAARAAVADGYMKQCTGLWIVAQITRAVDNKAAKSLLGNAFKRQLRLDGTYGNVTFICSKTDDISVEEAVGTLNLSDEVRPSWTELDDIKAQINHLKAKLQEAKEAKSIHKEIVDECDDELEIWEDLQDKLEDGKIVYAPTPRPKSNKRKRGSPEVSSGNKKRRTADSDDDFIDDDVSQDDTWGNESDDREEDKEERQPLTEEDVDSKIQELKSRKKEARRSRDDCDEKLEEITKDIRSLQERQAVLDHEISALCIAGRNDYSKGAIQQDFAAGIKELDQETAQDEDEENFDPEADIRDYDEVARSLPVFCISSRAYQKLCGRMRRDKPVPGFKDVAETEVPQLQAHCKRLTEAGRSAASRKFLNNLSQTMTSLKLWASRDGHGTPMTAAQQQKEAAFLDQKLSQLEQDLDKVVDECLKEMVDTLTDNIFDKYDRCIQKAFEGALSTADGWGAPRSQGGLYYSTYKATVRRNGVFAGVSGARDFNEELAAPIIKNIATGWERSFQRQLPTHIDSFVKKTTRLLDEFHHTAVRRSQDTGVSQGRLHALNQQLQNYGPFLEDQVRTITEMMTNMQREANRDFTPVVSTAMLQAYDNCALETGPGQYLRMKQYMHNHVERQRHIMFRSSCNVVKESLNTMCANIKEQLAIRTRGVYQTARRDYTTVLGNMGAVDPVVPAVDHVLKDEVHKILDSAEEIFRRVVEGEDGDRAEDQQDKQVEGDDTVIETTESADATGSAGQKQDDTPDDAPRLDDIVAHVDANKENVAEVTDKTGSLGGDTKDVLDQTHDAALRGFNGV